MTKTWMLMIGDEFEGSYTDKAEAMKAFNQALKEFRASHSLWMKQPSLWELKKRGEKKGVMPVK